MKGSVYKMFFLAMTLLVASGCGGGGSAGEGEVLDPNYNPNYLTISYPSSPGTYTTSGAYLTSENPVILKGELPFGRWSADWNLYGTGGGSTYTPVWFNHATGESGVVDIFPGEKYYTCEIYNAYGICVTGMQFHWIRLPTWEAEIYLVPGENLIEFTSTIGDKYDIDSIVIEHATVHEPSLKSYELSNIGFSEVELNVVLETGGVPCDVNIRLGTDPELTSYTLIQNAIQEGPHIQDHSIILTDLRPGVRYYYYDVSVVNHLGTATSQIKRFTTPMLVKTLPATDIEACGDPLGSLYCAILHGEIITENIGRPQYVYFEIDADPAFNTSVTYYTVHYDNYIDSGNLNTFQKRLINLSPNTTYYFRAYYRDYYNGYIMDDEWIMGETLSFTTPAAPEI